MSARDLAAASGVSPSTVSRVERGKINPTVAMLERLLKASGVDLEVRATPHAGRPTLDAVRAHSRDIDEIISSYGASNARVFGSVARGDAGEESDVDLLIDVSSGTGLITVERITEAIQAVIPWRVDVVTSGAARGTMAHILDEAIAL